MPAAETSDFPPASLASLAEGLGPPPVLPGPEVPGEVSRRERRNLILLGAALILSYSALDFALGAFNPRTLAWRLVWAAALAVLAAAQLTAAPARLRWMMALGALISPPLYTAIILECGGLQSPHFAWLFALPMAIVVAVGDEVLIAGAGGASTLAAVVALAIHGGASGTQVAVWASLALCSVVMAVAASRSYQRLRRAAAEAWSARGEALLQLAESERRRGHAERLAFVGRMAAGVAHEINNPLAYLKANLDFVREELGAGHGPRPAGPGAKAGALAEALSESEQGVERIRRIVLYLRQFSDERPAAAEGCAVEDLFDEALRRLAPRPAGFEIERALQPGLPSVRVRPQDVAGALAQLLANAMDAAESAPGGRRWIRLSANAAGERVELAIDDAGPGIAPEAQARLYVPFFTTKPPGQGTGLGLALAREHLQRSGGTLELANRPEGGAQARVTLPRAPPPPC